MPSVNIFCKEVKMTFSSRKMSCGIQEVKVIGTIGIHTDSVTVEE